MKKLIAVALLLAALCAFADEDDEAREKAMKIVEEQLRANPDIDPAIVERMLNKHRATPQVEGVPSLEEHSPVSTDGLGDRLDEQATVEPVRHESNTQNYPQDFVLVAPTYPGSVAVSPSDKSNKDYSAWQVAGRAPEPTGRTRSFLSKDSLEAVNSWYESEVGEMESGSLEYQRVPKDMRSPSMRPDPFTFAHGTGYSDSGSLIGVEIQSPEPADVHFTRYPAIGPVFERLNASVISGHTTQGEFDRLLGEYKHVGAMYFPMSDQTSDKGHPLSQDKVIFDGCEKTAAGGMDHQQLQARMQQLMAEGNTAEMQKLSRQLSSGAGIGSNDAWVDCLAELEREGYRTLITIHGQQ